MSYTILEKKQSFGINKAFIKQAIVKNNIEIFAHSLNDYLTALRHAQTNNESEEHQKALLKEFLQSVIGKDHYINTKDRIDLAIYGSSTSHSPVNVIIEVKSLNNKNEMLSKTDINKKALHEALLYYARERIAENNINLKYITITNGLEWFIFDAQIFEKLFYNNKQFIKAYNAFKDKILTNTNTDFFYNNIAKQFIANIEPTALEFAYINLADYHNKDITELKKIYKLFSKEHLLKLNFLNDSNSLNKGFYDELLYILGLTESKQGAKKIIVRHKKNAGSILEATIEHIRDWDRLSGVKDIQNYGTTEDERLFNVALGLNIVWLNRILFLKLLEAQLISYHPKEQNEYRFLNIEKISSFDQLDSLFFQILARKTAERKDTLTQFSYIPYLNSSLFESSELEKHVLVIGNLPNNLTLPLYSKTVLKDNEGKPLKGKLSTLEYLFRFLDAYNFSSEGSDDIQEDNKSLINASVLGLIFEKINGYKEGSFFTPSFITMYMCQQSIRKAVLQKFNNHYGWQLSEFNELYNKIEDKQHANQLINSLKICDPAVGSGHFLVSALNEIIAIKSELKILMDTDGKVLRDYDIEVSNDELVITIDGELFSYNPKNKESQRVQKTLFHEKQTIIENCLFGVDINPNSANICRLRLWIELLKHAYYKNGTELETLPNIDINIKCGNSLISRFTVRQKIGNALKKAGHTIQSYKNAVYTYKNAASKDEKRQVLQIIDKVKDSYKEDLLNKDYNDVRKVRNELESFLKQSDLFANDSKLIEDNKKKEVELNKKLTEQENKLKEKKEGIVYQNAFEWRFEFPEVLNDEGEFIGFDTIIGNPPYGVSFSEIEKKYLIKNYNKIPDFEIYYFFINKGFEILNKSGLIYYIIPNSILFNVNAKKYRSFIVEQKLILEIIDCSDYEIFSEAKVRNVILGLGTKPNVEQTYFNYKSTEKLTNIETFFTQKDKKLPVSLLDNFIANWSLPFKLPEEKINLIKAINNYSTAKVIDIFPSISQGLIPYDKYRGQDPDIIQNRVFHSPTKKNETYMPWLHGKDITPYSVKWTGQEYFQYVDGVANPRKPYFFNTKRILIREITNPKIYAAITESVLYHDPSLLIISEYNSKNFISLEAILGILNSRFATFYHFNSSPKATKGIFPKILIQDIKNFPIPKEPNPKIVKMIENKVKKRLDSNENNQRLENEIDFLVYKLYGLTYDEVLTIDPATPVTPEEYDVGI